MTVVLEKIKNPFDIGWRERILVLGSVLCVCLMGIFLGFVYAPTEMQILLPLIPVSIFVLGKFLPLVCVSETIPFAPWQLGLVVGVLDVLTIILFVYGLSLLLRISFISNKLTAIQYKAQLILCHYPKIRRVAIFSVMCFVLFPIAGTGALFGGCLGTLLGLHRTVLIASVSVGGFIGGLLMALLAVEFQDFVYLLKDSPTIKYTSIVMFVGLIAGGVLWLQRIYNTILLEAEQKYPTD